MDAQTIIGLVKGASSNWASMRKSEERNESAKRNRRLKLVKSTRVTLWEAVSEYMIAVYLAVSSDGKYPAHARQLMYEARRVIQSMTNEPLNDKYFTQN